MNNETYLFALLVIWYTSNYGLPYPFLLFIIQLHQKCDAFLHYCNHMISPEYFLLRKEETHNTDTLLEEEKEPPKTSFVRYEDKYLEDIRKLEKDYVFDEVEKETKLIKYFEFWKENNDVCSEKIETIKTALDKIENILTKYQTGEDDYCVYEDNDEDVLLSETKEQAIQTLTNKKRKLTDDLLLLQAQTETTEGQNELMKKAVDQSYEFMVNKRLEKLQNCYIMENTPLGNVLMIYDTSRLTFRYYSDNTIPYRYLETVARKYVKCYNCRPIFIDMEEELNIAEEKWEKEKEEREKKAEKEKEEEEKRKLEEHKGLHKKVEAKKSVFAKFKSYNKDSAAGKSMVAPPKNSIPNKPLTQEQENEKVLLKDKANRYTYEGKLSNFNFLKKVERKVVDKKYAMTFADFKKMQQKK
jgi:hypothetical protein